MASTSKNQEAEADLVQFSQDVTTSAKLRQMEILKPTFHSKSQPLISVLRGSNEKGAVILDKTKRTRLSCNAVCLPMFCAISFSFSFER